MVTFVFSNVYLENFKKNNLYDPVLPNDAIQKEELISITDAVFYTIADLNGNILTLKLAGINTECISTAKFCLREAANHFAQKIFLTSDDPNIYYQKEEMNNDALVWIKYKGSYYLLNLLLLYNEFAFIEGDSDLFEPYLERLNQIKEKEEESTLNNKFGDSH
ncbi:MAG: hypothetical protein ACOC4J_00830 [Bacteroidota bacterium]